MPPRLGGYELTSQQKNKIVLLFEQGVTKMSLAQRFGVSEKVIRRVIGGEKTKISQSESDVIFDPNGRVFRCRICDKARNTMRSVQRHIAQKHPRFTK